MSGSFLLLGNDGSHDRTGGLSVSLASPDGRVIDGMLVAACSVQVIVGSFLWTAPKANPKFKEVNEGGGDSEHYTADSTMMAPPSGRQSQHLSSPTSRMGAWATPQAMDLRNSHMDIDPMRG